MILPVALISACFLISASLGSEESCYLSEEQEDQCASVCYPIVKPLLRYFEKSNEKDFQLLKCKTDFSELQKRYSDLQSEGLQKYADLVKSHLELENKYEKVLNELKDSEVKYERLFSNQQEGENLKGLINEKNAEIQQLKEQISDLKKPSELATLTNQFREDIAKLGEIVKTQEINANRSLTTPLPNISNPTTPKTQTTDFCSRNQEERKVIREIQIPGSSPFKVGCHSYEDIGSGWMLVFGKNYFSKTFHHTYEDYELGFGDAEKRLADGFFVGLQRLHLLSNEKPLEVVINTKGTDYKRCDNFVVGDRSESYMIKNIENCTGNHHTWLSLKQGSKFSALYREEDGRNRNFAGEGSFGWWFDPSMRSLTKSRIRMWIR